MVSELLAACGGWVAEVMWQIVMCDGRAVTFWVHRVEMQERMEGDPWCWK